MRGREGEREGETEGGRERRLNISVQCLACLCTNFTIEVNQLLKTSNVVSLKQLVYLFVIFVTKVMLPLNQCISLLTASC